MTHKVLLADDSLTIQKVIKITLANEPYVLLDCRSEAELMNLLDRESPHLVLLDFSLSETRSGYELCKMIRAKKPQTAVLMMYGTFDTVDENALKNCGAKGKIIKPFDSGKFISLCKSLVDELDENSQVTGSVLEDSLSPKDEVFTPAEEEDVNWVVDAPTAPEKVSEPEPEQIISENVLEDEMKAWGMNLPGKITGGGELVNFPPKIAAKPTSTIAEADKLEAVTLPESNDLEYPDLTSPTSKLVPLSELAPAQDKEFSFEESTGSFELSLEDGTTSDEDIRKLEEAISDELEHTVTRQEASEEVISKIEGMSIKNFADLWSADEIEDLNPTMKKEKPKAHPPIEVGNHDTLLESHADVIKEVTRDLSNLNLDKNFEAQVREAIKPIIEQMVKEYCKQTLEKVAWEVIPDLAENLIKKELQKITDSIIGE